MEMRRLKVSLKELPEFGLGSIYVCLRLRTCMGVRVGDLQRDFKKEN